MRKTPFTANKAVLIGTLERQPEAIALGNDPGLGAVGGHFSSALSVGPKHFSAPIRPYVHMRNSNH
jgi:hypothetical protein